jgi:hypothetical protein
VRFVHHVSILPIRVVTISAVDNAVTIPVAVKVLSADSVVFLHLHSCLPARVGFRVDGW